MLLQIKILEHMIPEWVKVVPLPHPLGHSIATFRQVVASVEQRCLSCWTPLLNSSGDISQREICVSCCSSGRNGYRQVTTWGSVPQCIYCGKWDHAIGGCQDVKASYYLALLGHTEIDDAQSGFGTPK
jgi:hypothetical protein